MRAVAALLRKDVRIVYRDSLLVFLPLYALILALVMRLLVSFVPVADLGLYLAPAIVQFGSILLGTVLGFALIEEREQGTWLLLRVLPLRQSTLFLYLVAASTILSSVVGLAAAMVYGYPIADPVAFSWMLVAGSLLAPVVMLVLGVLATNKVEGLAVNKLVSISLLLPALVFVAPLPWQLVAAWLPGYWVYLGLLEAYAVDPSALSAVYWPNYPGWLLVAAPIALSLGGTIGLARAYMRRAS